MKQITSNSERFNKLLLIIERNHKAEAFRLLDDLSISNLKQELSNQFRTNNHRVIGFVQEKALQYGFSFNYLVKNGRFFKVMEFALPVHAGFQLTDPDKVIWTVQVQNEPPFEAF